MSRLNITNKVLKYCTEIIAFSFNFNSLALNEAIKNTSKIKEWTIDLDNLQFHINSVETAWKNLSNYLEDDLYGSREKMLNAISKAKEALLKDQISLKRLNSVSNVKDVEYFIKNNLDRLEMLYQIVQEME